MSHAPAAVSRIGWAMLGGSSEQPSTWRAFLGRPVPSADEQLEEASLALAQARELAESKTEQIELAMAMLKAAEEELSLRSNQLEITREMLRTTEAELQRKEEQLTLNMQMLAKAEAGLQQQQRETSELRQQLHRLTQLQARDGGGAVAAGGAVHGPGLPIASSPRLGAPVPSPTTQVGLAHGDAPATMRPKAALRDTRLLVHQIQGGAEFLGTDELQLS